ncbi:two-component system activity regulator YycH [Desulfuribacillus alkaliarsenatis]|uniref:Regulatory protein YycH domain-containing protein n=1 Tax=Desulfuribacillus alkaliarsenatis TaxID=766136 RepID=A0A1E5G2R7_9FIRM|nr:two-component system activity regulator YycH [Desulfuribacillus alkaliarsenatis]OEF97343.1 hypothetical protein BHF68_03795 [Desulfuribacillus alkaliarsenatis]
MIEQIKTGILSILVITSILMSSMLWYSAPSYAPLLTVMNIEQTQTSSTQYNLDDIVIPREFVAIEEGVEYSRVHPSSNVFNTIYDRIKSLNITNVELVEEAYQLDGITSNRAIEMRFFNKMPVEYLGLVFRIDSNELNKLDTLVHKVTLFYDNDEDRSRILFEGSQIYIANTNITEGRLAEIINLASSTAAQRLQATDFAKQTIRVTELSNSLFPDPTAIRQIEEVGQSVIYTDGSRGLRINHRLQTLDYTDPTAEYRYREVDFATMVQEAIKFLNRHHSLVGNYILAQAIEVSRENNEYTLVFQQQYNGYPILSTRELAISEISLKMKNNRVIRMNHASIYLGQELERSVVNVISAEDIKTIIERRIDISDNTHDIYLGYYPVNVDEETIQLRPVWVLTHGSVTRNVFDAVTGQEIRI